MSIWLSERQLLPRHIIVVVSIWPHLKLGLHAIVRYILMRWREGGGKSDNV
jgi:hypothetical protein